MIFQNAKPKTKLNALDPHNMLKAKLHLAVGDSLFCLTKNTR